MIQSKHPAFGLCDSCPSEYGKRRPKKVMRCDRCWKPKSKPVKRFAEKRDTAYRAFVREFPCFVKSREGRRNVGDKKFRHVHECFGDTECAHLTSRGAGGDDVGNCIPLCWRAHMQQHNLGVVSFGAMYRVDQWAEAERIRELWEKTR